MRDMVKKTLHKLSEIEAAAKRRGKEEGKKKLKKKWNKVLARLSVG